MHEYTSTARVWGLTCPGFLEEVSRARRWTRDILRDSPLAEDAALIVSELSANAILHTASGQESGSFHLALAVSSNARRPFPRPCNAKSSKRPASRSLFRRR